MVRAWCVLCILTWKCASCHNSVHFFRHLNLQKCPEHEMFLAFSLANVLRATTACNFSSLIWPAGSAPAALASLLFDPPEPQIIGKTQCFATFPPFRAPGSSFFSDFLFCDLSSSLLFSDSSHPCFSSVHIVGSLTSKLPSMNIYERLFKQQTLTILSRRDCAIEALRHRAQTQGLGLEEKFECLMRLMQKT